MGSLTTHPYQSFTFQIPQITSSSSQTTSKMAQQPGDQKNTVDKLTDTASSIGTNVKETGEHYANKPSAAGTNVLETIQHEANKANQSAPGEKTYLEQAQDMAASALNTASKTASDLANSISGAGQEKK